MMCATTWIISRYVRSTYLEPIMCNNHYNIAINQWKCIVEIYYTSHQCQKPNQVVDLSSSRRPSERFSLGPNEIGRRCQCRGSVWNGFGHILSPYGPGVAACKYNVLRARSKRLPRSSCKCHLHNTQWIIDIISVVKLFWSVNM